MDNRPDGTDAIRTIELELVKLVRHLETFGRRSSLYVRVDRAGYLAMRMLEGQGVKYTDIPIVPPIITAANLDQWVPASWNPNISQTAEGPDGSWGPDSYLNSFFNSPQVPTAYKS